MGRPAILVPLPQAIDDHQTANARSLTDRGGAILLRQSEMNVASLVKILQGYLLQPQSLMAMATASLAAATPDATQRVSDCCEELLHG